MPNRWKKRPKGTDIGCYAVQTWHDRQKAWEFLRRSESYQFSYDVASGRRRAVKRPMRPLEAWDFGISEFVDYIHDWGKAGKVFKFRLYGANYLDPQEWPRITNSGAGRILYFRLNLNLAIYDPKLLNFQLDNVAKRAQRLFREYRERLGVPIRKKWHVKNTPQQVAAWMRYLRLLDLDAQPEMTNEQIETALYRKEGEQLLTSKQLNDKLFEERKQALEITNIGYLKFAIADRLKRKRAAKKS